MKVRYSACSFSAHSILYRIYCQHKLNHDMPTIPYKTEEGSKQICMALVNIDVITGGALLTSAGSLYHSMSSK